MCVTNYNKVVLTRSG